MSIKNIFYSLKGNWQLNRTISHHGTMTGVANLTLVNTSELFYREEGLFASGITRQVFKVYREYLYQYKQNQIDVFHVENHQPTLLLHTLHFIDDAQKDVLKAVAHHECGRDVYQAVYLFYVNQFQLTYLVKGPYKDYTITTMFDRLKSVAVAK
jgi:hypothetical protein